MVRLTQCRVATGGITWYGALLSAYLAFLTLAAGRALAAPQCPPTTLGPAVLGPGMLLLFAGVLAAGTTCGCRVSQIAGGTGLAVGGLLLAAALAGDRSIERRAAERYRELKARLHYAFALLAALVGVAMAALPAAQDRGIL